MAGERMEFSRPGRACRRRPPPPGRHPGRRPRSLGSAATIVRRPTRRRPRAGKGLAPWAQAEGTPRHAGYRRRTRRRPGWARRCSRKRSALVKRGEGEGVGRRTDGVQPPRAGRRRRPYPPGRHPGHRPRSLGSAATIVRRPHPPAATGRDRATMAIDAERAGGRVG
jgi:hypothetical protein